MEERHARHGKRGREFHLSVGPVRAVVAVELSFGRKHAVEIAHRHGQQLEGQGDIGVATELADYGGEMPSGRYAADGEAVWIEVEFLRFLGSDLDLSVRDSY